MFFKSLENVFNFITLVIWIFGLQYHCFGGEKFDLDLLELFICAWLCQKVCWEPWNSCRDINISLYGVDTCLSFLFSSYFCFWVSTLGLLGVDTVRAECYMLWFYFLVSPLGFLGVDTWQKFPDFSVTMRALLFGVLT